MDDCNDRLASVWPAPRRVTLTSQRCHIAGRRFHIVTDSKGARVAERLEHDLVRRGQRAVVAAPGDARATLAVHLERSAATAGAGGAGSDERYTLRVTEHAVHIAAQTNAGLFYGTRTWLQMLGWDRVLGSLPGCVIDDGPSFAERGFMLDVSRDKVPTMATLFELVELLADFKMNQLQLYIEHTFAYRGHRAVWADASPFTADEIQALDAHCQAHFIELVPNQNSFGHMQRWLKHAPYRDLAECPRGFEHPWNPSGDPYGLCPADPGALALLADLYDQLLPNFSSRRINVGLDETIDLGHGRSRERCAHEGTGRVYLDFLRDVHRLVQDRGHTMQFWADIVLHHPEHAHLLRELPKDVVALAWGYEGNHPFGKDAALLAEAGVSFYVCPGTSSWNSFAGRTDNAMANLQGAAAAGVMHHAAGYLVTDWGDNGHLQPLPVSYLGLLAGAGAAWNAAACDLLEQGAVRSLNEHVFRDRAGVMGGAMRDLGNAYLHAGAWPGNASALFGLLLRPEAEPPSGVSPTTLGRVIEVVSEASARLGRTEMQCQHAELIVAEVAWVRDALLIAARMGIVRSAGAQVAPELCADLARLVDGHRDNWLSRNRPGGLGDSQARLERARALLCGPGV